MLLRSCWCSLQTTVTTTMEESAATLNARATTCRHLNSRCARVHTKDAAIPVGMHNLTIAFVIHACSSGKNHLPIFQSSASPGSMETVRIHWVHVLGRSTHTMVPLPYARVRQMCAVSPQRQQSQKHRQQTLAAQVSVFIWLVHWSYASGPDQLIICLQRSVPALEGPAKYRPITAMVSINCWAPNQRSSAATGTRKMKDVVWKEQALSLQAHDQLLHQRPTVSMIIWMKSMLTTCTHLIFATITFFRVWSTESQFEEQENHWREECRERRMAVASVHHQICVIRWFLI